jgi:hypothetical protein
MEVDGSTSQRPMAINGCDQRWILEAEADPAEFFIP